jgi:hypothetical protein
MTTYGTTRKTSPLFRAPRAAALPIGVARP